MTIFRLYDIVTTKYPAHAVCVGITRKGCMPRMVGKNKDYISQTFKLRTDIAVRLESYKNKTGVPKTFTVEKALEEYLDKMEKSDKA